MKTIITIFAFILLAGNAFTQENESIIITKEQKIYNLSLIWQEINYNFPYLNDSDINWDSLYISTISKVLNATSNSNYYKELQKFVSVFHEGHTMVISPDVEPQGIVNLFAKYLNGDFYITGVGVEYCDMVNVGCKILEINNIDVKEYFDSTIYPYESCPAHIRYEFLSYKLFFGNLNDSLILTINQNDTIKSIILKRHNSYGIFKVFKEFLKRDNYDFKVINKEIAYIKIGSFSDRSILKKIENDLDSIIKCKSIILDVRDNGGGSSFGDEICRFFTKDSTFISYSMLTRINNAYYRALGAYSSEATAKILNIEPRHLEYNDYFIFNEYENKEWTTKNNVKLSGVLSDKKLCVLINPMVASAAETFLITLRNLNKGVFIGEPTYGSATQPLVLPLYGGGQVRIATQKTTYITGEIYNYIKPDIYVSPTIEDYLNVNDRVMNNAIDYLSK